MKRTIGTLVALAVVLSLIVAIAPAPASAIDLAKNGENALIAVGNAAGSPVTCGKAWEDEFVKRNVFGLVTGAVMCGINVGVSAVNSGITLGTLGTVPPLGGNTWTTKDAPVQLPK